MDQPTDPKLELTPTARQCWIFGLYAATMLFLCTMVMVLRQRTGGYNVLPLLLLLAPWFLGCFVVLLDRPGLLRNWLGPLLLSLFYPCLALWYDGAALVRWVQLGQPPVWAFAAVLNALLLGGFLVYLSAVYPKRCPDCGQRSLVPLLRLGKQEKQARKTRWCASCGAKLSKDDEGHWQHEHAAFQRDAAPPVLSSPLGLSRSASPG